MANELVRVGRLSLVKSLPDHAEQIADNLRLFDKRECYIHGLSPIEALTEPLAVSKSKTYTIKLDHKPIAMCGTVPQDVNSARVWMLGTSDINNNFRPFLRGCKPVINLLQANYSLIENFVPADHHDTIMWLSWCGFVFDETIYELHGHNMMRFVRCKSHHNDVIAELIRPVMH